MKGPASKAGRGLPAPRGFESHPLRTDKPDSCDLGCQATSGGSHIMNHGEMREWLIRHAWRACRREIASWVRIPLSPQEFGRARRGVSGALNPQTAIAGRNPGSRHDPLGIRLPPAALKARSCAMRICEPRQAREGATVSRPSHVPQVHLAGASDGEYVLGGRVDNRCTANLLKPRRNDLRGFV